MDDKLLTVEELAAMLRTTPAGIYNLQHRGSLPPSCVVGRRRLFPESRVKVWLEERIGASA